MRARSVVGLAVLLLAAPSVFRAQAPGSDPLADGLIPGDYLRIGGSAVRSVNPQGSLKDWKPGYGLGLVWENWDLGRSGVGRLGYGIMFDYSLLPLDEQHFLEDFKNAPTGTPTSATAKRAGVFQAGVTLRYRIPAPFIMPSFSLGFGFLDWHPGQITYTTASGTSTAKQQHRTGGSISIGGGLDKHIYDRWALFGEAVYTYGFTSFGEGLAGSGSSCIASGCDLLKNTPLGTVRGGLRVRVGR